MLKPIFQIKYNLTSVLIFSFCVKLILLYFLTPYNFPDSRAYINGAKAIVENNYAWPSDMNADAPLAFYFYSIFYLLFKYIGAKALALENIIIATVTVYIIYLITKDIFNKRVALIAATIVAIYPFFNFYSINIFCETFYIFIIYLSFYFAIKVYLCAKIKNLAIFTIFFTISILIRFEGLAMYPFFLILLLFYTHRNTETLYTLKAAITSLAIFILIMSPWWYRNYIVHGRFVATSVGETGKVFYTGNNPMNKTGGGIIFVDVDYITPFQHIANDEEKEKAMFKAGIEWIKNNPADWLVLEFRKLIRLYSPIFYADSFSTWYYNLISILSYGVIFILFLLSFLNLTKDLLMKSAPMLLFSILLTGVHLVFIASIRYRLPIEPYMIIMASGVISKYLFMEKNEKN